MIQEIKEELENLIEKSYGSVNSEFASHSSDADRAKESLILALENGIDFNEFISLHENYLKSTSSHPDHINEQLKKVKKIESYFFS